MRIQDDWCRMVEASPRHRASLGKGWIGSLSAAGGSANSGCDFGSILTSLVCFCSTLYGRPSNDQDQPESSSQLFACPYFCPWWPVAPGRRPEHPPSPDERWLGSAGFCYFENGRFLRSFLLAHKPSRKNEIRRNPQQNGEKSCILCTASGLPP